MRTPLITELLTPAEIVTLVFPVISMTPEVQTPSPCVVLFVARISLLSTENCMVDGLVAIDQLVAPASDVVPLAIVKFSSQMVPVLLVLMVTVVLAVLEQPVAVLVTVKLYVPAVVTTGFCAVEVKLFGPVQLYETLLVDELPERVTEEPPLQLSDPLALALASGAVVFSTTMAVSVPLQPVAGF